ncbi:MAG: penicillin-binding protein, partial [Pedobacter sp.]|nr:penicillin-binding protein [Pedobacter sp.]
MRLPKINIPKKYIKAGAWILGIFVVLIIILGAIAYSKREALLKKVIARAITKADRDYGLSVKIGEAGFNGLSTVHMKHISVVPKDRDT